MAGKITGSNYMNDMQWADLFPEMEAHETRDPRVFCTHFKKEKIKKRKQQGKTAVFKTKKYFACIVNGTCYGVDVIRPWASNADKECDEAFTRVVWAADYYENYGKWPEN